MAQKLSVTDIQDIITLYTQEHKCSYIAKALNIKLGTIRAVIRRNNVPRVNGRLSIPESQWDSIAEKYLKGETSEFIAKQYQVSYPTILNILKAKNVDVRTQSDYVEIDRNAFSNITEENSAYFYGWLLTDGCLSNGNISLSLKSTDSEVLYNLKDFLKSSNQVTFRERLDKRTNKVYKGCTFNFRSPDIESRLRELGFCERKSCIEVCPDALKTNRHFWRGAIEGDGCIYKGATSLVSLVGSKQLLEAFSEFCSDVVGLSKSYPIGTNGAMHVIQICSYANCKKLLDFLYHDCNHKLTRKYETYQQKYSN